MWPVQSRLPHNRIETFSGPQGAVHTSRSHTAAAYFQGNILVLEESFHGAFPPKICQSVILHATIAPCVGSPDSPQRHRVSHSTSVESASTTGVKHCHGPLCNVVALSRLNAKCRPSDSPSYLLQRRALCHGAEPLVHVFLTYRLHGGVLVDLTSAAL
jgi:hypothetical protein